MRHFVVPILIEFELSCSEIEMTLWASTMLSRFKAVINGAVILFEATGKERYIGAGMVRGFKAYTEGSWHYQEADKDLYQDVVVAGSFILHEEFQYRERAKG